MSIRFAGAALWRSSAPIHPWKSASGDWRLWPIAVDDGLILRSLSVEILNTVDRGRFLDDTINLYFSRSTTPDHLKPLVHEITSGVIRWQGYLDWVLRRYVSKPPPKEIRLLLLMTLYQVAFMKKAPYHVVKEAVEFAKSIKDERTGNFVNAVLRGFLRDCDNLTLPDDPVEHMSVEHSFPTWMVRRWLARFGEEATVRLLDTMNRSPYFSLRIRREDMGPGEVGEKLQQDGIASSPGRYLAGALSVTRVSRILAHELFHTGLLTIQDEASQLSVRALNPQADNRILDACAGLGTKTVQLCDEHPDITVISMDVEHRKLRRLVLPASRIVGDARRNPFREGTFDGVLIDAPCTSLGIIGKHPEIKWRRNEADIQKFARLQLEILKGLWSTVRTGGIVVYSVCSFEPEETIGVIKALAEDRRFALENPLPFLFNREYFLSVPHETGMDGFFIARLRKK